MTELETRLGKWVVAHRWWVIVICLLCVAAAGLGMARLEFTADLRVMFSEDNPQLAALEELEDTYTRNDTIFFAVAPKAGDVFAERPLSAISALTEMGWQLPYSLRVDSLSNFPYSYAEGDDLVVEELAADPTGKSEQELDRIRRIALSEPDLVKRLISVDGKVAGVLVTLVMPHEALSEVSEVAAYARDLTNRVREDYPEVEVYLTGGVMIDNAFAEAGRDDMTTLVPLMFLVLITIVGLTLRAFWGTLATMLVILFSMVVTMGIAGWTGILLNAASVNAPTIILTLAVADSVHILATMRRLMRMGESRHGAVALAVTEDLRPVFLTSLTTVIGFLSMNLSEVPPFRDLGNMVALGIGAAFFLSILFLPALMAVLPIRVKAVDDACDCPPCDRPARFVIRRRRAILFGTVACAAVFATGLTRVELNDDFLDYIGHRYEIRGATDFVQEHLSGWDIIEYSIGAEASGGISEPAYLERLEAFADWYRSQPKVVHVHTLTSTMKRLNRNMHGDDPDWYRLPENRELAAQYLLLYELSLPFGLDLNDRINVDKSATRFTVTMADTTARELRETDDRARAWLAANAPQSMQATGSGLSVIWAYISKRNINSMLLAAAGALLLISLLLIAAFRNVKLGLISLVPNLVPAIMAFGVWGWLVGWVGIGLSLVASMTIGVIVDDTVHFLTRYLRARQEGRSPERAVTNVFHTVGTPLWVTTVALVAGFLVLTLSGYRMNADMGAMAAMTIAFALALDFLFLPALLLTVDRKTVAEGKPDTAMEDQCRVWPGGCRCPACLKG